MPLFSLKRPIIEVWLGPKYASVLHYGSIHSVRAQNVPKNLNLLPPDTHMYMYVSGVRNVSFTENVANVLNEWSLWKKSVWEIHPVWDPVDY